MRPKATTPSPIHARVAATRARNRVFVAEVNARTVCAHCGAQPIEWHNPDHVLLNREDWRIGNLVWQPAALAKIREEMARCTPLCRRCHMREDGRVRNLRGGGMPVPPSPCVECQRVSKPLRKGLCSRCYDRRRYRLRRAVNDGR